MRKPQQHTDGKQTEKQGHENATKTIKYANSKIPLQTIIMHVVYQIVLFYLILNSKHSFRSTVKLRWRSREWATLAMYSNDDEDDHLHIYHRQEEGSKTFWNHLNDVLLVLVVYTPYYTRNLLNSFIYWHEARIGWKLIEGVSMQTKKMKFVFAFPTLPQSELCQTDECCFSV